MSAESFPNVSGGWKIPGEAVIRALFELDSDTEAAAYRTAAELQVRNHAEVWLDIDNGGDSNG